jgi:hypothetical protein
MSADPSPAAPYEALAAVIERELAVIPSGDFARLQAIKRERAAIVRRLPRVPPPEAREALARCRRTQAQIIVELQRVRQSLLAELGNVRRGRRAASGYAPARLGRPQVSASA